MTKSVWFAVAAVFLTHQVFVVNGGDLKRIHSEPAEWENEADPSHHMLGDFVADLLQEGAPQNPDNPDADEDEYESGPEVEDDERVYKNPRNSPSAICPRDEAHARFMGQKCLRKCSSDEDCKSKRKKCRCDGACGMSCIKPERECSELKSIESGSISMTGRLFGSIATYSCDPGFYVVGLKERTCQADGQWSGKTPTCKLNSSPCVVPLVVNGTLEAVGPYKAPKIEDPTESPDENATTTTPPPTVATPRAPPPHTVPHGDQLIVHCEPQYEFLNSETPVVCNNGSWSVTPTCEPGGSQFSD